MRCGIELGATRRQIKESDQLGLLKGDVGIVRRHRRPLIGQAVKLDLYRHAAVETAAPAKPAAGKGPARGNRSREELPVPHRRA